MGGRDRGGAGEVVGALAGRRLEDEDHGRAAEEAAAEGVDGLVEEPWGAEQAPKRDPAGAGHAGPVLLALAARLAPLTSPPHRAHASDERVEGIVQARHRGPQASLEHVAQRGPTCLDARERESAERACRRCGMEAQGDAGDDAQHALAADEERGEVGPVRATVEPHHLPAADDALEGGHHVLDLAVAARALPRTARGDPAAGGGAEDRRGEVAGREAAGLEVLFEADTERARLDLQRGGLGIELPPPLHALEVDHDRAGVREHAAAHARAGAEGDERHALGGAEAHHRRDLGGVARPHHQPGAMLGDATGGDVEVVARPEVARVGDAVGARGAPGEVGEGPADRRGEIHLSRARRAR